MRLRKNFLSIRKTSAFASLSGKLRKDNTCLLYTSIGSLDAGKDADVVILDKEYSVVNTFVKGKKIEV